MQNNMDPALADESPDVNGAGGTKRKSEEGGAAQQRAKRNRYISIAWCVLSTVKSLNDTHQT